MESAVRLGCQPTQQRELKAIDHEIGLNLLAGSSEVDAKSLPWYAVDWWTRQRIGGSIRNCMLASTPRLPTNDDDSLSPPPGPLSPQARLALHKGGQIRDGKVCRVVGPREAFR